MGSARKEQRGQRTNAARGRAKRPTAPNAGLEAQRKASFVQAECDAIRRNADETQVDEVALNAHAENSSLFVTRFVDYEHLNVSHLQQSAKDQGVGGLSEHSFIRSPGGRDRRSIGRGIGSGGEDGVTDAKRIVGRGGRSRGVDPILKKVLDARVCFLKKLRADDRRRGRKRNRDQ